MHDFFEMADERQHREHHLDEHTVLPLPALTEFEVGGIALSGMEARVTQDYHASVDLANEPLKGIIGHIGRATVPPHHQAILVHQQTELPPDNPAMSGEAFAPNLLRAPTLSDGVDELDPIGVDHPEHGRSSQEGPCPGLMRLEEAEEPGALGEVGKQGPIVARQPAMERPVAHAFEGMEESQGD